MKMSFKKWKRIRENVDETEGRQRRSNICVIGVHEAEKQWNRNNI